MQKVLDLVHEFGGLSVDITAFYPFEAPQLDKSEAERRQDRAGLGERSIHRMGDAGRTITARFESSVFIGILWISFGSFCLR